MDAHQPAEPGVPIWYVGHHLPTPKNAINGHTLRTEVATGVSSPTAFFFLAFAEYTKRPA